MFVIDGVFRFRDVLKSGQSFQKDENGKSCVMGLRCGDVRFMLKWVFVFFVNKRLHTRLLPLLNIIS